MSKNVFIRKYGLALKIVPIVFLLIIIKFGLSRLGFQELTIGPVLTSFLGGAIFLIGFLLAGTLSDYKESEKLPAELGTSIKTLYNDFRIASINIPKMFAKPQSHIRKLATDIKKELKKGNGINEIIFDDIEEINNDLNEFAKKDVGAGYIIKMRNELTAIEKTARRIKVIKETSFIPAAYAIVEILVGMLVFMLVVANLGGFIESIVILTIIPFILIYMVMLIKDIDDPFEGGAVADVDLTSLEEIETYLNTH